MIMMMTMMIYSSRITRINIWYVIVTPEEITVSHPPTYGDRLSTAVTVEERRNGLRTMRLPDLT